MKRSSKYDVFNKLPDNGGFKNKTFKEKIKFIWKIIRVGIYLFLASLALTGCIQSMVLQSSSTVGSGIELYNSKDSIAPYVNNFKINKSRVRRYEFDTNGNYVVDPVTKQYKYQDIEINTLDPLSKENFLVSNETIKQLKLQLDKEGTGSYYGAYNNHSSSLRIVGLNGKEIVETNKGLDGLIENFSSQLVKGTNNSVDSNFLFMNDAILNHLNKSSESYHIKNTWMPINFFTLKKPESDQDLTPEQKNIWGLGITSIDKAFQAYEQPKGSTNWIPVKVENGQYVTYDVDGDGINDSNTLVVINNPERIAKFKFAFSADVVSIDDKDIGLFNSEKYARDFLQSLANVFVQFSQVDAFISDVFNVRTPIGVDEKFKTYLSKANFENKLIVQNPETAPIDPNKLLTQKQKNAIINYQNDILNVINKAGFGIKKQIYDDPKSAYSAQWTDPYQVEFLPNILDKRNQLIGAAPIEQKPIASWGDAWGLGPFYGLVVWPIAYTINGLVGSMPSMDGWGAILSIIIAVIATRVITTLFTYKSLFSQHKQQALAPKKAKIDAKYEGYKGNKQLEQRKRQEIAELYKKNNVSMTGPLLGVLITMPIFLAMWRVIQGIPDIKSSTWLGIQFSLTSWRELFGGAWQYLPLLIVAVLVQALSQLLPRFLNRKRMSERANVSEKAALKKANKTQNIMMIFFIFLAVAFEAGVQIYWIVGGIWQIFQTLLVHWIVKTDFYKEKLYKYV